MRCGVHVEVEAACLRGWPEPKHRVARNLTVVGVMIRSVVRVFMRMGKGELYRQLTGMADEGQEDQHEYERRRYPPDHSRYSSRAPIFLSNGVRARVVPQFWLIA